MPARKAELEETMYWLRFSKCVQYLTTFVMHVISVVLTFNIFFSPLNRRYVYEDLSSIAVYHRNAANRYWFVFSSLISMLLLGVSIIYYTVSYGSIVYQQIKEKQANKVTILFSEGMYRMNIVDFGFVSVSIAWNIIWAVHLLLQCALNSMTSTVQHDVSFEEASPVLLLSTQITLIALRYPSLFQELNSVSIYGLVEKEERSLVSDDIVRSRFRALAY